MSDKLKKIVCPVISGHKVASGGHFDSILMLYEESESPSCFYVHCPTRKCSRWIRIKFRNGIPITKVMKKNISFPVEKVPTMVTGDIHA